MSYILDALKKAERERRRVQVPTLSTLHPTDPVARRHVWPWAVAGALLVNAGLLVVLFWIPLMPPRPRTEPGARPETTAPVAVPDWPVPQTKQPAGAEPRPVEKTILKVPKASEEAAPPRQKTPVARMPAERQSPPERPAEARVTVAPEAAPAEVTSPALRASQPARPGPAPPSAEVRLPVQAAPTQPSRESPAGLRDAFAGMRLDALVYSEVAAERMVFINGGKYLQGQVVDGKYVVEGITPDGAILTYQGQRFLLKP